MKTKERGEHGQGTADHLMTLDYLLLHLSSAFDSDDHRYPAIAYHAIRIIRGSILVPFHPDFSVNRQLSDTVNRLSDAANRQLSNADAVFSHAYAF